MSNRIEKAINRLRRNSENNKTEKLIQFENEVIKINKGKAEFWVSFIFIICLILIPILITIHQIIFKIDYLTIGLLIIIILVVTFQLLKVGKGNNKLEINLKEKKFKVENNHLLFRKIFHTKIFKFQDVLKSELNEKSMRHKHSTSKWLRLYITTIGGEKLILTDFESDYPTSSLAYDIKYLIDSIITDQKK